MSGSNSEIGGVYRTSVPDFSPVGAIQQKNKWSDDEMAFLIKMRKLRTTLVDNQEMIALWEYAEQDAINSVLDFRAAKKRAAERQEVKAVVPGRDLKAFEQTTAMTGGVGRETLKELVAEGCFATKKCPKTGTEYIVWSSFHPWWAVLENRARARRMHHNALATVSADQVKAAAEQKTREEILSEAAAAELERCRRARGEE